MAEDDKNKSSAPEEDEIDYKHTASEIEALRAILEKRKQKEKETDNPTGSENDEEESDSREPE